MALEQFHITRLIHRSFNVMAGHMIVPLGLTNAHHELILFFGTVRPEAETALSHRRGMRLAFRYSVLSEAGPRRSPTRP